MSLQPPERFTTERLLLRKPVLADAPIIYDSWTSKPGFPKYMSWVAHKDVSQTKAFLRKNILAWEKRTNFQYCIDLLDNKSGIVGKIDMHPINPHCVGFGYLLAEKYWDKGYMSGALTCLVDWALNQDAIYRAEAFCDPENPASARVMEKAGMEYEGRLKRYFVHPNISSEPRDSLMYAKVK